MKLKSVLLLVLLSSVVAFAQVTLPEGSEIKVRTDTAIPAKPNAGAAFSATVSEDVMAADGRVAIPRGSRARLIAIRNPEGDDTTLDLRSVTISGRSYSLVAPGEKASGAGVGVNKKTAKYVGGGAAVGAVLGALLGGGKGAAIGALVGGGGGAAAQVLTGKKKAIPAETELSYKLAQDLQLRSASRRTPTGTMQRR